MEPVQLGAVAASWGAFGSIPSSAGRKSQTFDCLRKIDDFWDWLEACGKKLPQSVRMERKFKYGRE